MKKFLLSLLVIPFLFVGFSNAQFSSFINHNIEKEASTYNTIYLPYGNDYAIKVQQGTIKLYYSSKDPNNGGYWQISACDGSCSCSSSLYCGINCSAGPCKYTYSYGAVEEYLPVSSLTPAINGLHDTVIELIPYVIYIGIGVLLFILGFIAVRWLVNRMGGKIKGIFSSKKR